MLLTLAFRNILRNARRSLMTMLAVAIGTAALLLFGEFVANVQTALETGTVRRLGHLSLFHSGYFLFGAGSPAAYGIEDYAAVIDMVRQDPDLAPMLSVVTPTVSLTGIAGNFAIDASKTFLGTGFVPSDRDRMQRWDEHRFFAGDAPPVSGLSDQDATRGIVGVGLARILGLCAPLAIADCPQPPAALPAGGVTPAAADFSELAARDRDPAASGDGSMPRIDLLAATAGGAPNVVSLSVSKAEQQGVREIDDNYVAMPFTLAQQLLYGRGDREAVAIVLQLARTEDLGRAKARLASLIAERKLDLEVRDFKELNPFYGQVLALFGAIFTFIAVIMGVIVLFTVVNTMGMSVMERTAEIGTARAIGVRRDGIRRQFLIEGWMLGAIGATAGLLLGSAVAYVVNHAGFSITFPGQASAVPFRLLTVGVGRLIAGAWLGLVVMATLAALLPANRAARLPVVDALRHV